MGGVRKSRINDMKMNNKNKLILKLIYDKAIVLSIFQNRDEQEYLMILVLFFLPLIYYGNKLSMAYMNKKNEWVE